MERRPETDAPRAVPALPAPVSAALVLGAALALGAGEAAAQGVCMGEVVTGRTSRVLCDRGPGDMRDIHIDLRDPAIVATGYNQFAIVSDARGVGDVTIEVTGGSLTSSGDWGKGIRFWSNYRDAVGDVVIRLKDVDMTITGLNNNAIFARRLAGTGNVEIDVSGGSITATTTKSAIGSGIFGHHQALNRAGDVTIAFRGSSLLVNGLYGDGVHGQRDDGVQGEVDMIVADASIETRGLFTRAISGISASRQGDVTIDVSGNSVITAEGESGVGVYAAHTGNGSVDVTIGAATRIAAPFSDGVHGRLTSAADAAGRVVIASGAAIEARDAGILAFTEPRSGSTFGDGNEAADETVRTAPMIHVTSSGDVTVGGNVMDAYIRAAVAGEDETLQTGEQAVLDAIAGGDSDALDTALGALPDDYDDAWKARMRAFQTARGAKLTNLHRLRRSLPGTNAKLAEQATIEILDIPRAGIRAMALSPTEIADYVRRGGLGGSLQDDERTVLAAVLTGGDLEAALGALPADYTDTWKDGVRLRAMSYNSGDIRVDVTGGMITSEGDGVHARHVVPHDRNGAITVTVDAGAEITGGRHGIFVGGAGLAAGNDDLRAQTVTVNGAVMGGTGAGVRLAGGGTVTVGETGRVGAASGVGILSDGAGDLVATVAGTVEGDVRAQGGGALTVDVMEGGTVTGTVHDPAGPLTVHGSIGRLLYTNGGTVTVAGTGQLTGIEGETEALRSEAGDLAVTVAGTVAGDLRAPTGGALTVDVQEGGTVTGTVHDPAGPLTVAGSIGRLLYGNGGTVTVAATGRLTGVEVGGGTEALRSEAGNLDVTVAGMVAGDLRAPTGGALTVDVQEGGEVTGTVHDPAGPLTVAGSIGRLLYSNGGTVTVAGTGRLTGVEVEGGTEALRGEAGDLDVTVAGTITGDVIEEGAGDLSATISGTVEGNVFGRGAGEHTVTVADGGTVTGTVDLAAEGGTVTVGGTAGRVRFDNGGTVTVAATGRLTGVEAEDGTEAIRSDAGNLAVAVSEMGMVTGGILGRGGDLNAMVAGTIRGDLVEEGAGGLSATVTGTVEGNLFGRGAGEHTVTVADGGTVTGTIGLAAEGGTVTVGGTAGRVRFDNGGTVTVAGTGRLTGVEVEGGTEALRGEAGDLDVTVAGTITGDVIEEGAGDLSATISGTVEGNLFGRGAGEHTVTVADGGTVTGTVDLAAEGSSVTVDGTAGRVRFDNGGTVTVAGAGRLTGVEAEDGTEAIRSDAGNLAVAVSEMGMVTGRILGRGGDLNAMVAGTVRGDLVEEGAGGLSATVTGTVEGNVFGRGAGEHTVTVADGGTVTGTIDLAASTVTVGGTAGRVRFGNGGTVTVAGAGRLTGVEVEGRTEAVRSEAGDLTVAVSEMGTVTGGILGRGGDLNAVVAGTVRGDLVEEGAGGLSATVAGTVEGDVFGRGAGEHTVTVADGGTVTGTIDLAAEGSTVTVDGTAGRVRLDGGGVVRVGANGQVPGIEGQAITSARGDLEVVIQQDAGETPIQASGRIRGTMHDADGEPEVRYVTPGGTVIGLGPPGSMGSVPDGAWDVGVERMETRGLRLASRLAPRSRMYEALPRVLLGLNGLAEFRARMEAAHTENGGWARVETLRGERKADASTAQEKSGVESEYAWRRHGLRAGVDTAVGEDALLGVSFHHRRGSAEVSHGGEVELSGNGVGMSGAWSRNGVYVDLQAEATRYEADFESSVRGVLKRGVSGRGHALGVEAGWRLAPDDAPAGMILTPRVRLVHSRVSVSGFTDAVGTRVSVDEGRSLRGFAGVAVETGPEAAAGSRWFVSADVEHEFRDETKVAVSGEELVAVARPSQLRLGLGGVHRWGGGRYAVQGKVDYATSGAGSYQYGGGLNLRVRF